MGDEEEGQCDTRAQSKRRNIFNNNDHLVIQKKILLDGTIDKYKARLCAHGGMQQWDVNY